MNPIYLIGLFAIFIVHTECIYAQNATIQSIIGCQTTESVYNGNKYIDQQIHYDGLGRPIKKFTTLDAAAEKPDLIQLIAYDEMGRDDAITYLPYIGTGAHLQRQCLADHIKFYRSPEYGDDGEYAYGLKTYDDSPLNIVTSISSPGEYHNAHSPKGHPVRMLTRLNQNSDQIKNYIIQNDSMIYFNGWYGVDLLTIEEQCIDQSPENTLRTRTYKNSKGQVIVTSVQANDEEWQNTYYVYDKYYSDRLRCVIPPMVDKQIRPRDDAFVWHKYRNQIRFLMYDDWGNMTQEYYPGREPVYYVYDLLHRVILSQDGELRQSNHWIYTRYDDLGRIFQTKRLTTTMKKDVLWAAFMHVDAKSVDSFIDSYFYDPLLLSECRYFGYNEYKIGWDGIVYKKICTPFVIPSYLSAQQVNDVFYKYAIIEQPGQKIYEKISIIPNIMSDSTAYVERAFYYDSEGRLIQSVEKNSAGGIIRISNKYDFAGNVLIRHESVQPFAEAETDIKVTICTYDDFGRVLTEKTTLNNSPEASVAYTYDQLGHCVKTIVGDAALKTDFKYDIAGNLTSQINEVLQMQLYRERPFSPSVSANYAGRLSECRWNHRKNVAEAWHGYQFSYTPYGEFQEVQLQHGPAMQTRNVEKNITYDLNGNILTLQRTGTDGSLIADYTYRYDGNRLDSLISGGTLIRTFSYDANGNLVTDSKTGCKYHYNILNLPESVQDSLGVERVRYTYLFDGTKVRVETTEGDGYSYLGSLIYDSTPTTYGLESSDFSHGRIIKSDTEYSVQYHVRDHLGSIRSIVDANGEVLEINDYYPFGQRWDKPHAPRTDNRYLFNGKETQEFVNLPLLDYGARMYDSEIGRWWVQDPKATDYYPLSPYAYCANDPINLIDPDGCSYKEFTYDPSYGIFVDEKGIYYTWESIIAYIGHDLGYVLGTVASSMGEAINMTLDAAAAYPNPIVNIFGLMAEFLCGIGPENREFDESSELTLSIKNSNMTKIALKKFYDKYANKEDLPYYIPISFAPFGKGDTGPVREFKNDGFTAAQFLGSAAYYFDVVDGMVNVRVYDTKTPFSLFYHVVPARYSRDKFSIMGETKQNYFFSIPLNDLFNLFE